MIASADYRPDVLERIMGVLDVFDTLLDDIDEDEDPGRAERVSAGRARRQQWLSTPALRHVVTARAQLSDFAPVTEYQRAIAARSGCTESTVRHNLTQSPRFAHWRAIAGRLADVENVAGYRPVLKLLVQPWAPYACRYAAIMAGEEGARIVLK